MGRQKKIKIPALAEGIKQTVLPKIVMAAVILLFIVVAATLVKAFLYRSDYFRLRAVETSASFIDKRVSLAIANQVLNAYRGRNVFKINLKYIAQTIQNSYGDIKDVVVRISLPDKLVISMKLRKPVALVKNAKYYPVDEEGVVIPGVSRADALKDLPIIEGVNLRQGAKNVNLRLALRLLKEIDESRFMAAYGVSLIIANEPSNMSFYLKNGLEVKIGGESFRQRLDKLGRTLRDPRLLIDKIKYIDVRFKDVYIGPK
ncbi:MAG: cell division protein FtsQ/DivIB [Candidatus Omnitrophica bacterium]|nr:cell division protein FtsQ/DivIB [Candidatus Omnitrophota bacterium]MCM8790697.1 cell division protein FtsQ/DivIB [Candidatus Omnitrophota bacterium]